MRQKIIKQFLEHTYVQHYAMLEIDLQSDDFASAEEKQKLCTELQKAAEEQQQKFKKAQEQEFIDEERWRLGS